jgi:pimeloyl-ACP methyl ester carboxylesterase
MILIVAFNLKAQTTDTILLPVDGIELHTVLSKPLNTANCPLAIIIAGSGPTDLNGNQINMQNNSLKYLSEALVENNIATLRFDKRGIAKSTFPGFNEADLSFDQYAGDVESIIRYFREKGYKNIFVIGHSEGSLLGLLAIQKTKVEGFVSVAGAGSPADEIIKKQLKPQLPPDFYSQVVLIIDSLKNKQSVKNVPPQLNALFRPSVQPYLISWFQYNPVELIGKLSCPTLIVQGDKDIQVDLEEANKLDKDLKTGKLLIVSNMNHVLKTIKGNDVQENFAAYTNPDLPVHPDLVKGIVAFINQNR